MLQPVFDPLHRTPDEARGGGQHHSIGRNALLDAEAAAGVRGRPQAQTVARHLEGARHHGMYAERTLEVGENVEGILVGIVFGHDAVGFDRRAGIARIADRHRQRMRCRGERAVGIAIGEAPVAHQVGARGLVQHRRVGIEGAERIDDRGPFAIARRDQVHPVFGQIAIGCHHDRDGLADIADPVDRDDAGVDGDAKRRHERTGDRFEIAPRDHGDDAGQLQRGRNIDVENVSMRVRGTQDGGVQGARLDAEIVDVAPTSRQQGRVFDPLARAALERFGAQPNPPAGTLPAPLRFPCAISAIFAIPSRLADYRGVSFSQGRRRPRRAVERNAPGGMPA